MPLPALRVIDIDLNENDPPDQVDLLFFIRALLEMRPSLRIVYDGTSMDGANVIPQEAEAIIDGSDFPQDFI